MISLMKLWVGITDDDWFRFLAQIKPDEVNCWQPSGRRTFQGLQPGELFLFEGTRDLMAIYQVQRCAWVNGAQGDLCAGIPQGRKHSVRAGGVKKRRDDQRVLVAPRSHARNSRMEPNWEAPTAASAGA